MNTTIDMPEVGDRYRDKLTGEVVTVKTITQWGRTYYTTEDGTDHAAYHSDFWNGSRQRFVRVESGSTFFEGPGTGFDQTTGDLS